MAVSSKYGNVTVERGELLPDEPVFLIRAKDMLAEPAVLNYASLACERDRPVVERGALNFVADVWRWQSDHTDLVKLPD